MRSISSSFKFLVFSFALLLTFGTAAGAQWLLDGKPTFSAAGDAVVAGSVKAAGFEGYTTQDKPYDSLTSSSVLVSGAGDTVLRELSGSYVSVANEGSFEVAQGVKAGVLFGYVPDGSSSVSLQNRPQYCGGVCKAAAISGGNLWTYDVGSFGQMQVSYGGTVAVSNILNSSFYMLGAYRGSLKMRGGYSHDNIIDLMADNTGSSVDVNIPNSMNYSFVNGYASSGYPLVITNKLLNSLILAHGGTYGGKCLLGVGENNTQLHDYTSVVGAGITTFKQDASYCGSFVAGYGNGSCSTNNRYYFGSGSWLFVSGTNLMFRNSAGSIGTVNVTY